MVQPFCSVYTRDYRNYEREQDRDLETPKPCLYYTDLKENFIPAEDSKNIYIAERDEAVLKELYLKRLITTYQLSYCSSEGKKSLVIDPNNLDADQFMVHFNHYYSKKTQPVPPPLETSRRIFHYSRFENYYTGKSTYEDEISREAYEFFKRDYDAGKSRLFRKKQKAMQEQKEPDKSGEQRDVASKKFCSPAEYSSFIQQKIYDPDAFANYILDPHLRCTTGNLAVGMRFHENQANNDGKLICMLYERESKELQGNKVGRIEFFLEANNPSFLRILFPVIPEHETKPFTAKVKLKVANCRRSN